MSLSPRRLGDLCVAAVLAGGLSLAGCGGSSGTTPTQPTTPTPPAQSSNVSGTVIDSLTARPIGGVEINVDGIGLATSADDGTFTITAPPPQQAHLTTLSSNSTVQRKTHLKAPGPAATLSLIASSFDLASFDQMFRGDGGELHRWTQAPSVVVQTRTLQFTAVTDVDFTALGTTMSDADVSALIDDLTWTLPQLTGNSFMTLANQQKESATEGATVHVSRPGFVVVARYSGLQAATGFWGYTRWAWNGAGAMQAAFVMLDKDFEASTSSFHRSLHAHEFGHALGYNHVTLRASVMNSSARVEPTPFDRDGAKLAYDRPPLNRTPDIDPDPFTMNLAGLSQLVWRGDK